jgi:ring-1,2-phenylacetyl-CoA epoxidase subunit PaaD
MLHSEKEIWDLLSSIPDPEIPVISITDLGVLRKVELKDNTCTIDITPTYSGCPAMKMIEDDIIAKLKEAGIENIKVNMVYHPAWTTDWLNDAAKEKLRAYGIAPPEKSSIDKGVLMGNEPKELKCPRCGSKNTEMISQFGSTACKALYRCQDCKEPFDYFKCI